MSNFEFSLTEGKYKSPQDILQRGVNSQLLSDNEIFREAVGEMYNRLTLQEDMLLGQADIDDRHLNQRIKHFAMMRCLLSDLITTLDGYVFDAETEKQRQGNK